jgi:peptidoglycan/xylan/chitin deacetylase (PgdA/CDA1 family)
LAGKASRRGGPETTRNGETGGYSRATKSSYVDWTIGSRDRRGIVRAHWTTRPEDDPDAAAVSHRLLVLAWHNVEPTWCFPATRGAGTRGLQAQLAFLRRTANVVPLAGALATLGRGDPVPPRAVALTFDDGYRDQLELAVPMLERLELPATFFLVPGLLEGTVQAWWEQLAWIFTRATRDSVVWEGQMVGLRSPTERRASLVAMLENLKRRDRRGRDAALDELLDRCAPEGKLQEQAAFLDWDGARRLARHGFTVASHSLVHSILAEESGLEQEQDLVRSRRRLQQELDLPVDLLAYPNGKRADYSRATVAAAARAGYSHALTTVEGWNRPSTEPYEVRRFVQQPERGVPGLAIVPLYRPWSWVRAIRDRRG